MPVNPCDGGFRADVQWKGKRGRFRAATKAEADTAEAVMLANLKTGKPVYEGLERAGERQKHSDTLKAAGTPTKLSDLAEMALKRRWSTQKDAEGSYARAKRVVDILGDPTLSDIGILTVDKLVDALKARGNTVGSINKALSVFSVMTSLAEERGLMTRPKIQFFDEDEGRIRSISDREEVVLLTYLPQPFSDFVGMAIDTGMRRGELFGFDISRSWNGRVITLWGEETKAGNTRTIVPTRRVRRIIDSRQRMGYTTALWPDVKDHLLRYAWDKAKGRMNLQDDQDFVFHACRHTCATRLVEANVNLRVIQKWMGHKAIETTLRYAHVNDQLIEAAAAALDSRLEHGSICERPVGRLAGTFGTDMAPAGLDSTTDGLLLRH